VLARFTRLGLADPRARVCVTMTPRGAVFVFALLLTAGGPTVRSIVVAPAESIAVTVVGHGEPVVLIPGLMGSAFAFRRVAPQLVDAGFEVVIVEPLGIGASARPRAADYSLTAQAARVAAVLDTLGLRDAVVVAHSVGGSIAFRLAFHRPDLVGGIVSIEGGPAEEATTSGFRFAIRFAKLLRFGGSRLLRNTVNHEMKAASGDSTWVTDSVVTGYTADAARDFTATLNAFQGMAESHEPAEPLSAELSRVRCPVVLLVGLAPHSSGVPPTEVALLKDSLPAFTVDSIPGVGHFVFEESLPTVVDAVTRLRRSVPTVAEGGAVQR
jgi:pimeloyl-ACP methyl ester carboxylesterase